MGSSKPVVKFTFSLALRANFNVHLKMGSGGNLNRPSSNFSKVENDESVEDDFDDAREIPGSVVPNQNSSNPRTPTQLLQWAVG